ncbi:MAG: metallophosphoesterase [Parvibaculaceae bacterium]
MLTRRSFLKLVGGVLTAGVGTASYAFGIEPALRLTTTRYAVEPPNWPRGLKLRIVALADIHVCEPWMSLSRLEGIVETANALEGDIVVLLGDYLVGHPYITGKVAPRLWSAALARLSAPLGVHAILGNHDWWEDRAAQRSGHGPIFARLALEDAGLPVYENDAARLEKDGRAFWLAGLADQVALRPGLGGRKRRGFVGLDDLPGTLAKTAAEEPVILLAHEPDIFPAVPDRVALTLCGHTHGGQVRLFGYSPVVPSSFGNRYAYGQIVEDGRHLVVSGGLGCSIFPVRFGVPPEIMVVELS